MPRDKAGGGGEWSGRSPSGMFATALLALLLALAAQAENIPYKPCYHRGEGGKHCKITNIAVDPCREAAQGEPCKIKRGHTASISFDYETDFDVVGELKSRAYWMTMLADLPFVGMDTDACKMTTCPVKKDTVYHYNYTLEISKTFPAQRYDTKFKLWEDKAGVEKECCFVFKMKLI